MIDIEKIQKSFIKVLNDNNKDILFIQNYNNDARPPYPFGTINITTPYIAENETNKPVIYETVNSNDKLVYTRHENPQMMLSFNIFDDNESRCKTLISKIIQDIKFSLEDELSNYGIIILEVMNISNRSILLEIEYEYRFGFDVRIRTTSDIDKELDYVKSIEFTDKEDNKNIEAKE